MTQLQHGKYLGLQSARNPNTMKVDVPQILWLLCLAYILQIFNKNMKFNSRATAAMFLGWQKRESMLQNSYLIWKCLQVAFSWIDILILPLSSSFPQTKSFNCVPVPVPLQLEPSPLDSAAFFLLRSLCPAKRLRQLRLVSSNSDSSWNLLHNIPNQNNQSNK